MQHEANDNLEQDPAQNPAASSQYPTDDVTLSPQ